MYRPYIIIIIIQKINIDLIQIHPFNKTCQFFDFILLLLLFINYYFE